MSKVLALLLLCAFSYVLMDESKEAICLCRSSEKINYVCANDGITYNNPEEVECLSGCHGKNIKVVDNKPCRCNCTNTRTETREYTPVCANDGITYINLGAVKCHNKCYYHQINIIANRKCREEDKAQPH